MSHQASGAIGAGQLVSIRGVEQWITLRGRDLRNPAPFKARYSGAYTQAEAAAIAALPPEVIDRVSHPPADASYLPEGSRPDKDVRAVATEAYDALRQEILSFDAERLGVDFKVPMLFLLRRELDAVTATSEVEAYASRICAPRKAFVRIAGAGHSPQMMRDVYLEALKEHVLPILANDDEDPI